jgi:hypothetical protein
MQHNVYRYKFSPSLDITEVEATVNLAILATESLHGESRVCLEARYEFDAIARTCAINATGEVGRDLNRLFLGFISREFGRSNFEIESVPDLEGASAASVA